jgi:acetylornithine deacetylase
MMDVVDLTRELVTIPSPSGEENNIGKYLIERLKKKFDTRIIEVGKRFNIIATRGEPKVVLTAHMDTVHKPIPFKEDAEYIYGRGACDTKGSMAAMIVAAERMVDRGYDNIGLIFDVSEEDDFSGIKEIYGKYSPEFVIVGEPTNFNIIIGQKGLLGIKIVFKGIAAHGSTPEKGISAIEKCMDTLNNLRTIQWPVDAKLGPTTINIGVIKGGTSPNVVPDYAEAIIEIRTTKKNEYIMELLNEKLDCSNKEILYDYDPIYNNTDVNTNLRKITAPYFTEMYFWKNSIVLGPGDPSYAHSDDERILKKDLEKAVEVYMQAIAECMTNFKKQDKLVIS